MEDNSTSWPLCLIEALGPTPVGLRSLVYPGLLRVAYDAAYFPGVVRHALDILFASTPPPALVWGRAEPVDAHDELDHDWDEVLGGTRDRSSSESSSSQPSSAPSSASDISDDQSLGICPWAVPHNSTTEER
jgi:hypothetical protein